MTKKFLILILGCVSNFLLAAQSLPNTSVETIEGDTVHLNDNQERKMLIVIIPASHSEADSLMLLSIDSAYRTYGDSITFIGIPSYEAGYTDSLQIETKNWYRNVLHLGFIITKGMNTHNVSGSEQAPIFKWLTTQALNGHFDVEVDTHGQKFFLNSNGEISAVLSKETRLSNRLFLALLYPN